MKRSKDRHQMLAHSSSFRYRRSASPYLIDERSNPEYGSQLMPFVCPIEVDTSSSSTPSPGFNRFNGRDRSNSSCSLNYRGSPYDLSGLSSNDIMHPLRRNSDPSSPAAAISPPIPMDSEGEYDQPLDMSKKSRKSHDSESHHNNHYQHFQQHQQHSRSSTCSPEAGKFGIRHQQQQLNHYHNHQPHMQPRPSVITCASTLFGPRSSSSSSSSSSNACHKSSLKSETPKSNISPPSNSKMNQAGLKSSSSPKTLLHRDMANDLSKQHHNNQHHHRKLGQGGEASNKMLILREDSDSGIDEHFRRSLGEHYSGYTNVSMSVDDHFAKALGETWLKLKKEAQNGSKGSSYNKNVPSIPS